jgi:hypothetical protein
MAQDLSVVVDDRPDELVSVERCDAPRAGVRGPSLGR